MAATSAEVQAYIPGLAALAAGIGDQQVRNWVPSAARSPTTTWRPIIRRGGLGATIHTDRRTIAAEDFFTGMFDTALNERELITAIAFPNWRPAPTKNPNSASRYALVGAAVAKIGGVRVAVTGAGNGCSARSKSKPPWRYRPTRRPARRFPPMA